MNIHQDFATSFVAELVALQSFFKIEIYGMFLQGKSTPHLNKGNKGHIKYCWSVTTHVLQ